MKETLVAHVWHWWMLLEDFVCSFELLISFVYGSIDGSGSFQFNFVDLVFDKFIRFVLYLISFSQDFK